MELPRSAWDEFDDVILAAAQRAEYIAQCLEADRLRDVRQFRAEDSENTTTESTACFVHATYRLMASCGTSSSSSVVLA